MSPPSIETLEDPLNLTACDREQVEFIGSIQGGDAGSVLVVDMAKTPAVIVAYSENAPEQAWCRSYRIEIGQTLQETVWDEEFSKTVLHKLVHDMHEGGYLRTFTTIAVPNPDTWADMDPVATLPGSLSRPKRDESLTFVVSVTHCGKGAAGAVAADVSQRNFGLILLEFEKDEDINTRRNELAIELTEIGRILDDNVRVNTAAFHPGESQAGAQPPRKSGGTGAATAGVMTGASKDTSSAAMSASARTSGTPAPMSPVVLDEEETEKLAAITAQRACDAVMRMAPELDRGMVYRFADDMSGHVIHEVKKDFIASSYMGMRFPASDIPLSSRKMYIINGLRYIQNADDPAIPIISSQGMQVDLSHCRMRACLAPHIAYLHNMGVKSSMSVALVVGGELWGLLSFHGYTRPFKPSLHQRIAFETVSRMVSIRIESLINSEKSLRLMDLGKLLACLRPQIRVKFLCRYEQQCRKILRADAIAFKNGPNAYFFSDPSDQGLKPTNEFWQIMEKYPHGADMLVVSTRAQMERVGVHTHCEAAGMIYFQYATNCTLQFAALRAVRSKDVNWAGSPDAPKLQIGDILHPRKSFETYMEKARQESKMWSKQDTEIASSFRGRLMESMQAENLSILDSSLDASSSRFADAVRLVEQKYSFLAQMSHELRTPFQSIVEILQKTGDNRIERDEAISVAVRSGTAMMKNLDDMMKNLDDIVTMAKNQNTLQSVHFFPSESIGRITEVTKPYAESENIILTVHTTDRLLNIWCTADKTKVEQITTKLINNAIKFTPPGGKVTASFQILSAFQEAEEWWQTKKSVYLAEREVVKSSDPTNNNKGSGGGNASPSSLASSSFESPSSWGSGKAKLEWLCCAVEDTGCGIAEHDMDSLFRPYVEVSSGVTPSYQGTGLGLHICTEHVRNMSGVFRCASAVNEGTMFYFAVPVKVRKKVKDEPELFVNI